MPLYDNEAATFLDQVYERANAFLVGRRTYEIFAGYWGAMADPGGNPIWTALNTKPKYVASTTLTEDQVLFSGYVPMVETLTTGERLTALGRCGAQEGLRRTDSSSPA